MASYSIDYEVIGPEHAPGPSIQVLPGRTSVLFLEAFRVQYTVDWMASYSIDSQVITKRRWNMPL